MNRYTDRVVAITGAAQGLGLAMEIGRAHG